MSATSSVVSIQRELRNLGDPKIAQHSRRFFKTGPGEYGESDCFLGVRVPILRKLSRKHKHLPPRETEKLLASRFHEERLLAILILIERYKMAKRAEQEQIFKLFLNNIAHINNWDLVDTFAPQIVGPHLARKSKRLLFELAQSSDLWERRIAIMSCYFYIREYQFSTALRISKTLLNDDEDLVQKAVGWMLREIGNRDIKTEEAFLNKHYHVMPRTMLRYAIEKFPPRKRKRYLEGYA